MNQALITRIKPQPHRKLTSGGWIPPTEGTYSTAEQSGFTLLEAVIAMFIMLIVALASASLFSFSIYNNSGGSDRATSLAIGQQALERLRSAKFNSTTTDASLNAGSTVQTNIAGDGRSFRVTVAIDDDPSTQAIDVNPATSLKGVTVTVVPQSIGRGWAFGAGGTITLFTQRSRSDRT
jgi:prepilin-type N-terminal cleavage/methylation domain-containing protein